MDRGAFQGDRAAVGKNLARLQKLGHGLAVVGFGAPCGYDVIWFGVMIVVVTMMGVITPPVGVCVYVVSGMARDVPLEKIFRGSMPFLWALVIAAILLVIFPQIATFLPTLIK